MLALNFWRRVDDIYPSFMSVIAHVDLAAVIGKVSQDDAQIHKACEYTGTQTSNRCGGLSKLSL